MFFNLYKEQVWFIQHFTSVYLNISWPISFQLLFRNFKDRECASLLMILLLGPILNIN